MFSQATIIIKNKGDNLMRASYKLFTILIMIFLIISLFGYDYFFPAKSNQGTVKAKQYDMNLTLNHQNHTLSGCIDMTITNQTQHDLSAIYVRNYACALTGQKSIQSVFQKNKQLQFQEYGAQNILKNYIKSKDKASIIKIDLDTAFAPQQTITLSINYQVTIPEKEDRFGYIYKDQHSFYQLSYCFIQLSPYINGQWENPPYIENAEPDFNNISDYYVNITVPDNYTLVSSGNETYQGQNQYYIEAKQVRNIAMIVADHLNKKTISIGNCQINHYYPSYQHSEDYHQYVIESAKETMEWNSQHLGRYPYQQLDIVSCFYKSAMEYSGMIFLGLPDIQDLNHLDQTSYSTVSQTVAHEVSHQWFSITIGNDSYHEPWLDEAFCEYIEDFVFPANCSIYQQSVEDDHQRLNIDIGSFSKKQYLQMIEQRQKEYYINEPYDHYIQFNKYTQTIDNSDYSTYVYTNGSYFLYELSQAMNENTFYQMMQDYYQTYYFKEVTTDDFINKVYQYNKSQKVKQIINDYLDIK